jgi:hypothetical protein
MHTKTVVGAVQMAIPARSPQLQAHLQNLFWRHLERDWKPNGSYFTDNSKLDLAVVNEINHTVSILLSDDTEHFLPNDTRSSKCLKHRAMASCKRRGSSRDRHPNTHRAHRRA